MHLIDKRVGMAGTSAIVGGAVPIAIGAALAAQMKGEDRVVVVFLGDATTEEGVTSESLNFAALKQLPVVFFCENNFYSVQSPLATRQPPTRASTSGRPRTGCRRSQVDGMNVLAVYEAPSGPRSTGRAPAAARRSSKRRVYRFRAHGGAGDDSRTGYRARGRARRRGSRSIRSRMFGAVPRGAGRARPRPTSPRWKTRSGARSPTRSTSPSPARIRRGGSVQTCTLTKQSEFGLELESSESASNSDLIRITARATMPWDEGLVNSLVYDRADPAEGRVVSYVAGDQRGAGARARARSARVRARPGRRRPDRDVRHDARAAGAVRPARASSTRRCPKKA